MTILIAVFCILVVLAFCAVAWHALISPQDLVLDALVEPEAAPRCPRMAEATMQAQLEHVTHWIVRRGARSCSYCGSLHQDDFMAAVRAGARLGPTDKSYKVYIDLAESMPEEKTVTTTISWTPTEEEAARSGYVELTAEYLRRNGITDTRNIGRWGKLSARGSVRHEKFYFQHLTQEQRQEFVELYNNKRLAIDMPGHFYRWPFFMVPARG